jgi:hypothetical protein
VSVKEKYFHGYHFTYTPQGNAIAYKHFKATVGSSAWVFCVAEGAKTCWGVKTSFRPRVSSIV